MKDKIKIIVTGCGFKPVGHIYKHNNKPTHNPIYIGGVENKMNIGTVIAFYLIQKGHSVIMVSRTESNLKDIKDGLIKLGCAKDKIEYIASDITTDEGIVNLIDGLNTDFVYYWVQSIGMGAGAYKIPNDNIYLPFEEISPDLINHEMSIVSATHKMMLKMVPIFRKQIKNGDKAKVTFITSMSGERGYHFGATHVAAKHALVGYIKGIEKELNDEGIETCDVRPGGIDTGMYDNEFTRKAVEEISRRTKMWGGLEPIYAEPLEVAKAVYDSMFGENPKKIYRILAPEQS